MKKYIGFDSELSAASIVFFGIPYDGTVTFRPGSRFAPDAVRKYSDGLETYSPYQDKDITAYHISDAGDLLLPFGNRDKILQIIEQQADNYLQNNKKLLACGGEHLVSYPLIKAYAKKYPDLRVIHLDAHTDLREHYLGEKYSHSSVIRLITEFVAPRNIYQYGIRSGEQTEFQWGRANTNFYPFSVNELRNIKLGKTIPLYVTIDLDVLDPAYMSGTGTPEPGGVTFNELLQALLSLQGHHIVGADVVELAPDYDVSGASTMVAVKLIREMALLMS